MSNTTVESTCITSTKVWLDQLVIGHNFCPFAKKERDANRIRFIDISISHIEQIIDVLLAEIQILNEQSDIETTLIVFSVGLDDYDRYLDALDLANTLIEHGGYLGTYQLASFHPDYLFAGEDKHSPSHFTNRSPFPMLHIIREESLAKALASFAHPEQIPLNNIVKAEHLGAPFFQHFLRALRNE